MTKYHLERIREEKNFYPHEQGWNTLKEPSPEIMQLIAVSIGLIATSSTQ